MWWQVLPPSLTILGVTAIPFILNPIIQYVFTGRPTLRGITEGLSYSGLQRNGYRRDWSMTGCEFKSRGLDNITDDL